MLSVLGSRTTDGRICEGGVTGTVLPSVARGMLSGTGGVGIFQWLTGLSDEAFFSSPSPNVGEDLEPNQLLALCAPLRSIALGCRRRKSVLGTCEMGIGSEMPVMPPCAPRPRLCELECLIDDQPDPFECGRSSRVLCRPRQMTAMSAVRAPASMPGKNPTATAAPGKRGQRGVAPAGAGIDGSMPAGAVVDMVEVDEAEGDAELPPVELVALLITHCELLSQE